MTLWCLASVGDRQQVKPTWRVFARFGVSPDAGRRGLAAPEGANLVSVVRHSGRCPRVTIQDARETADGQSCGYLAKLEIQEIERRAEVLAMLLKGKGRVRFTNSSTYPKGWGLVER